jgi:putative addiction module component (TIGR02574 family)
MSGIGCDGIIDVPNDGERKMLDYDTIVSEAIRLPISDQLRLIEHLAASIHDGQPPKLSNEWLAEIGGRSAEVDAGVVRMEPWESVRARVFHKHGVEGGH